MDFYYSFYLIPLQVLAKLAFCEYRTKELNELINLELEVKTII